jgi:hypothetical protein
MVGIVATARHRNEAQDVPYGVRLHGEGGDHADEGGAGHPSLHGLGVYVTE